MSGEKFLRSKVIGVGGYLPDKVVTNDELSKTCLLYTSPSPRD